MVSRLASLLRRLVMGGGAAPGARKGGEAEPVDYEGFTIRPDSFREGSHWVTAAVISKDFDAGGKTYRFVRSDMFPSQDAADEWAVVRSKRAIDDLGDRVFEIG